MNSALVTKQKEGVLPEEISGTDAERPQPIKGLNEPIIKLMARVYEPKRIVELGFGSYDLAFKTDEAGRPILLFMGKKDPVTGKIKGERYARRLLLDRDGKIAKDHWDNKGKATARF